MGSWQSVTGHICSVYDIVPEWQVALTDGNGHQDSPSVHSTSSLSVHMVAGSSEGRRAVPAVLVSVLAVLASVTGVGPPLWGGVGESIVCTVEDGDIGRCCVVEGERCFVLGTVTE